MAEKQIFKNRAYKLKSGKTPLSFVLPSNNTSKLPLTYFDEEKGINRALRYAVNQKSPFVDEQDENPLLGQIMFTDGMLFVNKENQILQKLLDIHPGLDKVFVEIDNERDADKESEEIFSSAEAVLAIKTLDIDVVENLCRVLFHTSPSNSTSKELRRDLAVFAKKDPKTLLNMLNDPSVKLQSTVHQFFEKQLLSFRKGKKEVWMNTSSNKNRMLIVPFQSNPYESVAGFLKTDEGLPILEMLESALEQ